VVSEIELELEETVLDSLLLDELLVSDIEELELV